MKNKNKIIKLLRSGNFTLYYHDQGTCILYKGKHKEDELPEDFEYEFNYDASYGYLPDVVALLTQALKGKVYTA